MQPPDYTTHPYQVASLVGDISQWLYEHKTAGCTITNTYTIVRSPDDEMSTWENTDEFSHAIKEIVIQGAKNPRDI